MVKIKHKKTFVVKPTEFRKSLKNNLIKALKGSRIIIHSKDGNTVLMSLDDYNELTSYQETAYLLSSDANRAQLEESIKQAKEGKTTKVDLEALWK